MSVIKCPKHPNCTKVYKKKNGFYYNHLKNVHGLTLPVTNEADKRIFCENCRKKSYKSKNAAYYTHVNLCNDIINLDGLDNDDELNTEIIHNFDMFKFSDDYFSNFEPHLEIDSTFFGNKSWLNQLVNSVEKNSNKFT